jgi:AcrR family transcriptional regulator
MTEPRATRGRPKLPPEENETRERILDTAQRLFAERGYTRVTLRELTSEAGVNLASVNYYFGSKDALLHALIRRAARVIRGRRQRLLDDASLRDGSREERVRRILHALLEPAVIGNAGAGSEALYGTLLARARADGPHELTNLLERQTSHLDPYVEALRGALPEVPVEEIYWRLHFVLNIEHALQTELQRLRHLSKGLCDIEDRYAILERIVEFALPGLLAPPRRLASRR